MRRKKIFAISVVLFLLIFSIPFFATSQLRIVCIGNSITQGKKERRPDSSFEFSYRPWLWKKLSENGFAVDMVGFNPYFFGEKEGRLSMEFTYNGIQFDRDCEAYYGITSTAFINGSRSSGWTGKPLPKFSDRINDSARGYTPDIALIHIGTNDADSTPSLVGKTKSNIREIISVLRAKNPFVTVFLAKLITGWKKINTEIEGLCSELSTEKSGVIAVDLTTGFINKPTEEGTMTYDYVHPNKKGQLFMMEKWYNAIIHNLHDNKKPILKGKIKQTKGTRNNIEITWPAASDNYGIQSYQLFVNGKIIDNVAFNQLNYPVQNLEQGTKYTLTITAKDWAGNSSERLSITIRTKKQ